MRVDLGYSLACQECLAPAAPAAASETLGSCNTEAAAAVVAAQAVLVPESAIASDPLATELLPEEVAHRVAAVAVADPVASAADEARQVAVVLDWVGDMPRSGPASVADESHQGWAESVASSVGLSLTTVDTHRQAEPAAREKHCCVDCILVEKP